MSGEGAQAAGDELAARRTRRFTHAASEASNNLTCACGSEWWSSPGITVNAGAALDGSDWHPTGYALPLACIECGREAGAR